MTRKNASEDNKMSDFEAATKTSIKNNKENKENEGNEGKKDELKSIKSRLFSRGASLLAVGLKSTAKAAEFAITAAVSDKKDHRKMYQDFLVGRAKALVTEMENLKGAVMKAGQLLSIYGEHFFPEEINTLFKRLQSESKPVAFSEMEKVMIRSLCKEKYASIDIDRTPIGAASLGQVYRATIDGKDRVLKVQYPGVANSIDSDLKALKTLLSLSKLVPNLKNFDEIFDEVKSMLHKEADYKRELETLIKYQDLIAEEPYLEIPVAYPDYSGARVICMDYIKGRRFDDPKVLAISQDRKNKFGAALLNLLFKEIFEWQTVQTDPHIGNFLVQITEDGYPDDKIILLDFGAVRKLPNRYVEPFKQMALSSVNEDKAGILAAAIKMGFLRDDDPQMMLDLFQKIILKATEPFQAKNEGETLDGSSYSEKDYDWAEKSLIDELSEMGKDAIFSFKLRPPPREAIFVDRKLVGTAMILKALGVKFGPRKLALKYLSN